MTARTYNSPQAFKEALEQRLRSASKNGVDFARRRQLLVFDRFLARVVSVLRDTVLLKGGLVLELRLERARTTKDIDLRLTGSPETVLADLQEAGRQVLGDFMAFEVSRDTEQPKIQNDGMKYEGLRFRAECRLAGKLYGQAFGVDVAFGDPFWASPKPSPPTMCSSSRVLHRRWCGCIRLRPTSPRNCMHTRCHVRAPILASKIFPTSRCSPPRGRSKQCDCAQRWNARLNFARLIPYRRLFRIHPRTGRSLIARWHERMSLRGRLWNNSPPRCRGLSIHCSTIVGRIWRPVEWTWDLN